jgi:hypothetical protein
MYGADEAGAFSDGIAKRTENMNTVRTAVHRAAKAGNQQGAFVYGQRDQPIARRLKDLIARMTLEEKAAQMTCVWQEKAARLVDAKGNFDLEKAKAAFKSGHGIGQIGRPSAVSGPLHYYFFDDARTGSAGEGGSYLAECGPWFSFLQRGGCRPALRRVHNFTDDL